MPTFRRELAFEADRPARNTGDRWHLVFDSDAPALYVEHSWERGPRTGGESLRGSERFGINDFLTLAPSQAAHSVLLGALRGLFR